MSDVEANKAVVAAFWAHLYERDWDGIAALLADDAEYTDMPTPADDLAVGPEQILRRLRLGLEPISGFEHEHLLTVAEGDAVITEHAETWHWHTGESVRLPFVTVQEVRDGKIVRWFDYWDLQTLLGAAPQWWVDHIMGGYT